MKFLCVACDQPMKLESTTPPDAAGSLAATFACPRCAQRTAMLTNPWETEMVASLGVKIGSSGEAEGRTSRCPFSGMVREAEERTAGEPAGAEPAGPRWTPEALARLENVPDFVRPMARQGVEHYAASNGYGVVDERVLDEARERFGM